MISRRGTIPVGYGLAGKFLISMPGLEDPNFEKTVLFVCTHNKSGALGLVINQPYAADMSEILTPLGMEWTRPEEPIVYQGGPVALDRGFMLYETDLDYPGHVRICDQIYLGTNPDILRHMVESGDRGRFLFALGYSGWSSGQLENELRDNVWLVSSVDRHILFDMPLMSRWDSAIRMLGVDPLRLVEPRRGLMH
ncbi:YqgE/AlgH family protein [Candidatus Magnetaquicoccus inordinatus]|uniref:YqgE/AlgH family protein n=1 Tax=Candidatus Magnetaquicoccus inordinatus TaxID=2496818 RepID=UPI00102CF5FB|nr:YqgE/AlgH family protein [Candidatus Magnetaquicoccus inordinatus]